MLSSLFQNVILPSIVRDELLNAPLIVRKWIADPPPWMEVRNTTHFADGSTDRLDPGEEAAIALAGEINADLLLMDDRVGVAVARRMGIEETGTLGVLGIAARNGLLNLAEAFALLKQTNFRFRRETMDALLAEQ